MKRPERRVILSRKLSWSPRPSRCKKLSSAGGERACPASFHLHKQRAQCATVLDLSTVVVRAVRRGSRRGSQRNGRASRALGARLHKQRAQCATVLDLSTVGVTGVRGQESQMLVLGGVRPKQGAPKMKRPERRVLFHRTQPRLKLLQEGLQPTRRGRPRISLKRCSSRNAVAATSGCALVELVAHS